MTAVVTIARERTAAREEIISGEMKTVVKNAMDSAEITEEIMTAEIISEEMTDVAETAEETADVVITVAVTACRQFRHRQWQSF